MQHYACAGDKALRQLAAEARLRVWCKGNGNFHAQPAYHSNNIVKTGAAGNNAGGFFMVIVRANVL